MQNCGGNFDVETGSGGINLVGGDQLQVRRRPWPTGEYRLRYGGVGKVRAKVVGKAANIAKITKGGAESSGGSFHAFGDVKLTTKGANLLNGARRLGQRTVVGRRHRHRRLEDPALELDANLKGQAL